MAHRRRSPDCNGRAVRPTDPACENGRVIVDCAIYVDGRREDATPSLTEALAEARRRGGFVWIGVQVGEARLVVFKSTTFPFLSAVPLMVKFPSP